MHLRCGRIFNVGFIANFLEIVPVKELLKLVNIWWRYEREYGVSIFYSSTELKSGEKLFIDSNCLLEILS